MSKMSQPKKQSLYIYKQSLDFTTFAD